MDLQQDWAHRMNRSCVSPGDRAVDKSQSSRKPWENSSNLGFLAIAKVVYQHGPNGFKVNMGLDGPCALSELFGSRRRWFSKAQPL